MAAEVGQGEAEEPEQSDGNRLYGSIADKKRLGEKGLRRFMTIKKAEIFHDLDCSIQLVAEVGQGGAEEPERSNGNRLYGSIVSKKRMGEKGLRRFMTIKKAEIFYDFGCYIKLVAEVGIEPNGLQVMSLTSYHCSTPQYRLCH